ncbi:HigA family addiction module antitoxin [soil metagenome]
MMKAPPHPGRLLGRELKARDISVAQAARDLRVSRQALSGVIHGHTAITPEMAVRIGHYIGSGPDIWVRMQGNYSLVEAKAQLRDEIRKLPIADKAVAA